MERPASPLYGPVRYRQRAVPQSPDQRARRRMARRSDPGLSAGMLWSESNAIESRWDVTATASCGLGRSSSLRNSIRRAREPLWIQNIRQQLNDQLKCLDVRLESHVTMLGELQDFYRRRSEVELEYSRGIDKLVRQIMTRHKTDKQKRESWPGYSTYTIWQTLLGTTRKIGRDHAVLADLYSTHMSNRLTELTEDVQRVYKKCHEMALSTHEELIKVLTELQSAMKTYQLYHGECLQAENKLRQAENQRVKVEQQQSVGGVVGAKSAISRRFRNYEKLSEKKQVKYLESRLKAVKARNEYILCLEAANAAIQKYFTDDLHDLINTMDYGYHGTLGRVVLMHISSDENMLRSRQGCLDLMNQRVRDLDQRADKQTFLELFGQPFTAPRPFELHPHRGDETMQLSVQKFVQDELLDRLNLINERLNTLRVESEETWKTLETTDGALMEMITVKDYDVTPLFHEDWQPPKSPVDKDKRRNDRLQTENFYLTKFHNYQTINNLMARLQAKYTCIEKAISSGSSADLQSTRLPSVPTKPKRRKALGRAPLIGRPRLFGGTIEEYVEVTGEQIPLVVRSCVRIINLYGMHHQGVFRVSGSQHEITEFRNQFERGKDPLPDKVDGKDINSVAGVLKLYFRELRDPLFPGRMFDELIACSCQHNFNNIDEVANGIGHLKSLLATLPQSVLVVMRYLFAFLNHLSEFSDENMMDPYNLAICFGPTLLPVPSDRDQVQFQSHVNELIRTIIVHQDDIFPSLDSSADSSTLYERCLIGDDGIQEDAVDNLSDEGDVANEEDVFYDHELKEAVALYDFQARTKRELSFSKGDVLTLFERVSADWWEGATNDDRDGLIPDKYIRVRKMEMIDPRADDEKRKSTDSLHLVKTARLSIKPFDDSDDLSASQQNISHGTDTPLYSSGSVVWRSSCDDVITSTPLIRKKSSATDSTCSDHVASYRKLSEQDVVQKSSRSSDQEESRMSIQSSSSETATTDIDPSDREILVASDSAVEMVRLPDEKSSLEMYCAIENGTVLHKDSDGSSSEKEVSETVSRSIHVETSQQPTIQKTQQPLVEIQHSNSEKPGADSSDDCRSTDDLSLDIDTALAEVMSGLELLGRSRGISFDHGRATDPSKPVPVLQSPPGGSMSNFKRTPDLVIGLPDRVTPQPTSPNMTSTDACKDATSPTSGLTTAEVFANVDRCTIKKGATSTSAPPSADVLTSTEHPLKSFDSPGPGSFVHRDSRPQINIELRTIHPSRIASFSESVRQGHVEGGTTPVRVTTPVRSSSCRVAVERRSDQAWPVFMPSTSSDREFVRAVTPQFNRAATIHHPMYSPACDDGVALDRTELPKSPTHSVILRQETLPAGSSAPPPVSPERSSSFGTRPPVKAKPPVMKKPVRTGELVRRLNDQSPSCVTVESTVTMSPK